MYVEIREIEPAETGAWDEYVNNHPFSNLYHLSGWKNVIEKTYGHKAYYLMAFNQENQHAIFNIQHSKNHFSSPTNLSTPTDPTNSINPKNSISGILPLVHLKHFIFGNSLISIPFFDMGGILADDKETEQALLNEAIKLGTRLQIDSLELRHQTPFSWLCESNTTDPPKKQKTKINIQNYSPSPTDSTNPIAIVTKSHKVRMLLELPESSETLMKSFKSKLRSQIKKPIKEGLQSEIGGIELLGDFYEVFAINMRDLGSPVHSKKLMKNVLEEFEDRSGILMVYKGDQPVACSLIVGFKDVLENPWASSLRQYSRLSPNMLLYWSMLEYGCNNGYKYFDFGRSSPDEGTFKFKRQWGARPEPLHWHYVYFNDESVNMEPLEKSRFEKAISCWKNLPVLVTKLIGPRIRKYIGL